MKQRLLLAILFLGWFILHLACHKDDTLPIELQSTDLIPKITTISYDGTDVLFNTLKLQLHLDRYKESRFSQNIQGKSTTDTLGLIIATDIIKQVTLGDYTSYTMKIVHENDSTVFYNLTIEYKNGASDLFITKYTPTDYWLNNTNETYQGEVQSKRATLTEYTDPEDAFNEQPGGDPGNPDLGAGPGGGSGVSYSADYPWDCMGTVIVSTELEPYQCTCEDHWPWDSCDCSDQPGYDQIIVYACEESWDVDPYDPGDISNPGGGSVDPIPDDPAITVTIKPENCTERIDGDLDGDCSLDAYELCLLGNYGQEVCDCVAQGNIIDDCYFEFNPTEWILYEEISGNIIDLDEYLSCFDNPPASASFKLTVFIDQPIPNQDDTWTNDGTIFDPDINVGHTFISLEMNDSGTIINQNIGFYPSTGVDPVDPEVAGAWVDDGGHDYDVSVSIDLNQADFINLISFIQSYGTPTYNLNTDNCTDAAIEIANSAGMNLPDTAGSWIGGGGSNPGNLGQDVRSLSNPDLTINTTGGTALSSTGACN
ncbi:hypothetical protein [Winogradskyella sp.]|uniref:hypothetical protein n=1 Tax=Winogradskyella sp. TaxID=1883156 RepID=UPI003BAA7643